MCLGTLALRSACCLCSGALCTVGFGSGRVSFGSPPPLPCPPRCLKCLRTFRSLPLNVYSASLSRAVLHLQPLGTKAEDSPAASVRFGVAPARFLRWLVALMHPVWYGRASSQDPATTPAVVGAASNGHSEVLKLLLSAHQPEEVHGVHECKALLIA